MRIGYLGPEGTFTHEAALAAHASVQRGRSADAPNAGGSHPGPQLVSLPSIYDVIMAVQAGDCDQGVVPIENSLEGSVGATLDALAMETEDVVIIGETVHPIRHCLIARRPLSLEEIEVIVSHPQASGQCARFIRTRLARATVIAAESTAAAVQLVAERDGAWAALGNRAAAQRYECEVLLAGVEDLADNETRFVWLARGDAETQAARGPSKTAIVFWGVGSGEPGWLVGCLSEFAERRVNLTRIESRPRKQGLGRYMFFVDLEGSAEELPVREALAGLAGRVESLRVLGSFPAAI